MTVIKTNDYLPNLVLDKIVVDRRYHISPPGATTQFKINDYYLEEKTVDYDEAESKGLETLNKIMSKNLTGDVLFFTITEPTIMSLVEKINKTSPSHVIALPLFSGLRKSEGDWFDYIININKNLKNIEYSKNNILDVIKNGPGNHPKIPPNTYTMAILVATNVVEASLTIESLKFVIDTGYYNSVVYDHKTNSTIQSINEISEQSRLQRRGRVGRKSSGCVYYMYTKRARENNIPIYEIVSKDIMFDLFKLLHNFTDKDDKPIFNFKYHPSRYIFDYNNKITNKTFKEYILDEENPIIQNIYLKQYNFNEDNIVTNPLCNTFDYTRNKIYSGYDSGFNINTLLDKNGIFYLIHPSENELNRNAVTGIIDNKDKIDYYFSYKIINSFQKLQNIKYIYYDKIINFENLENEYYYVHKFKYYKIIDNIHLYASELIGYLLNTIDENDFMKLIKTICTSVCYDCIDDVLKILSLVFTMESYRSLVSLQDNGKYNNYDKFIDIWKNNKSELFSYLKIMNFFIIKKIDNNDIISLPKIDRLYTDFIKLQKQYGNKILLKSDIQKNNNLSEKQIKLFVEFTNLKYTQIKRNDKYNKEFKKKETITDNYKNISNYCKQLCLNSSVIEKALKLYESLNLIYVNKKEDIEIFKRYYQVRKTNHEDNIIKCFIENYLDNLCIYKKEKLINITGIPNIISKPKVSLVHLFETLCFYIIKTSDGPIGITLCSSDLLNEVIDMNLIKTSNNKLIKTSNIMNTTSKMIYTLKSKDNEYNINGFLENAVNIIEHVKKYKLKKIEI